jgi:hypothetical protein
MQIRQAKPGDEAELAFLLENNQRHYGKVVGDGAGASLAAASMIGSACHAGNKACYDGCVA